MHVKYCHFIFQLNKLEICFNEIHICGACGKMRGMKIYPKFKHGIS
jgi:hypothetical protein